MDIAVTGYLSMPVLRVLLEIRSKLKYKRPAPQSVLVRDPTRFRLHKVTYTNEIESKGKLLVSTIDPICIDRYDSV